MLEGDLGDFTLPDILQLLAFTSKTGRLSLQREGTVGRVDMEGGRLLDASTDAGRLPLARRLLGAGHVDWDALQDLLVERTELASGLDLAAALAEAEALDATALQELVHEQSVDALFDLLRWDRGSFRFDAEHPVERPAALPAIGWSVDDLLEEATRRLEDWPDVEERTGPGEAVVTIGRPDGDAGANITADGWALLALTDGRRTVDELISLSGQGEYRTRRTLGELAEIGVVMIGAAEPSPIDRLLRAHQALAELEPSSEEVAEPEAAVDERHSLEGEVSGYQEPADEDLAPEPDAERAEAPAEDTASQLADEDTAIPDVFELEIPTDDMDADGADDGSGTEASAPEPTVPPPSVPPPVAAEDDPDAEGSDAAVDETAVGDDEETGPAHGDEPGEVTPLRAQQRRTDRLRTDPSVDADMIERLIDGVENL